jgi:hypothetical protein
MALPDDFKLIREIVAAGGSRHTTGSIDRSRYQRLVDLVLDNQELAAAIERMEKGYGLKVVK